MNSPVIVFLIILALLVILILIIFVYRKVITQNYNYWYNRNGIYIYQKWSSISTTENYLELKFVNKNYYNVSVSWDNLIWKKGDIEVGQKSGTNFELAPEYENNNEERIFLFTPPKGQTPKNIDYQLIGLKVEKKS